MGSGGTTMQRRWPLRRARAVSAMTIRVSGCAILGWMNAIGLKVRNALLAVTLAGLTVACTQIEVGVNPPVDRLKELRVGASTKAEVRQIVGQPQGKGASRIPDYPGYRDLWSYEIVSFDGVTSEYVILLIFFEGDIYDGYLWFDNAHDLKETS